MAHVIFFEKPGCGGNARQKAALLESGHSLDVRDLLSYQWNAPELLEFMEKLPTHDWFNRASPRVKSGEIVPEMISPEQVLALLLGDHLLIRRPLLQVGQDRRVGWNEQAINQWIGLAGPDIGEGCPKHSHAKPCPAP